MPRRLSPGRGETMYREPEQQCHGEELKSSSSGGILGCCLLFNQAGKSKPVQEGWKEGKDHWRIRQGAGLSALLWIPVQQRIPPGCFCWQAERGGGAWNQGSPISMLQLTNSHQMGIFGKPGTQQAFLSLTTWNQANPRHRHLFSYSQQDQNIGRN